MSKESLEDVLRSTPVKWGEIGYIVFKRTYGRRLKDEDPNSKTEEFWQVVKRELDASDKQLGVGFTEEEKIGYAKARMNLKFSVAGRFMWQLGTKTVDKLGLPSLQNCAGVVVNEPIRPFTWAFEMLMLGSGVGYNIQKHNVYQLPKVKGKIKIERKDTKDADFVVPDSREGWVKLLSKVLKAHFYSGEGFTYSTICIRGKGSPMKGFGGTASGPEDLCWGITEISKILNSRSNKKLRPIDCLDIMNIIGFVVVAGNIRRSAQLAIGDHDDIDYLKAKRWDLGPIPNWRAMSNNSIASPDNLDDLLPEFWDTYKQGEPYGLINLELSKECGRTGDGRYLDPNVEVYNPCFTADTKILTPTGYVEIGSNVGSLDLMNKNGEVINGSIWSNGFKDIVEVKGSQGFKVRCTPDHRFMLNTGDECQAKDLVGKRIMPYFSINKEVNDFVKYGFIQGDGGLGRLDSTSHKGLEVNIGDKDDDILELFGVTKELGKRTYYLNGFNEILRSLQFDTNSLPNRCLPKTYNTWLEKDKLMFLKGMYSANGSIIKNSRVSYKTTSKTLSEQLVNTLNSFGITSYVTTNKEKEVEFSNGNYTCKESYDVNICKYESVIKFAELISFVHLYKQTALSDLIKEKAPKISSVKIAGNEEVFDFNLQDDTHWGVIEGVIAHNCAEQSLNNYETCCLGELYLPNIDSYEDLIQNIKYVYRMCKHSLALKCSLKETEYIVNTNMRMGIGVTGILQSPEYKIAWLENAYTWLRQYDEEYSKEKGFPTSIKLTTVKPSGTLSLLAGVTPGVHPSPAGPYYIRRVRISAGSPLIELCRKNGYFMEFEKNFDGGENKNTIVVEFPCSVPEGTPVASNFSWRDQLDNVRRMQREWSDNSVSCTVYYKKDDLDDIKQYLKDHFRKEMKTVSFLLYQGHGFTQAPYETVSKETYDIMHSKVKPITTVEVAEEDFVVDDCASGACPIR